MCADAHINILPEIAYSMAELHVIGRIEKGAGYPEARLFIRWNVHLGGGWKVVQGETEGQTQTDISSLQDAYFSHPLDFHLTTKTMHGWPHLNIEIWHYDDYGRQEPYGYGTAYIPTAPGEHTLICYTWRPKGGFTEELTHRFLGGGLQLQSLCTTEPSEDRMRLQTLAMGTVEIHLTVMARNFEKFGIIS
uniref:B9 domain-containing protein 2 n=1 Tax=Steinernema glaseri TaxID=37863 RepID=A0A1I7YEQ3_9BILA